MACHNPADKRLAQGAEHILGGVAEGAAPGVKVLARIAGKGGPDRLGLALNLGQGHQGPTRGAGAPSLLHRGPAGGVAAERCRLARAEGLGAKPGPGDAADSNEIALMGVRAEALKPLVFGHDQTVAKIQFGAKFFCI